MKKITLKAASLMGGAALFMACTQANAVFVSETYQVPGEALQQSYARLQAFVAGDSDEQVLKPLAIPYVGGLSSSKVNTKGASSISETYALGESMLRVSTMGTTLTGPSQIVSDGGWVFSVTNTVRVVASGYLDVQPTGPTDNWLYAQLTDTTTGTQLFESDQQDLSGGYSYQLGGLIGSHKASFTGSLDNTLFAGHVYQFLYRSASGSQSELSGNSVTQARIQLLAVPEPETYALLLAGLAVVGAAARRRKAA